MPEPATFTVPVFALGTVLFPDGLLPLRVFEPRYRTMVAECLDRGSAFAVALIREGREVGPAARCHNIATLAHIVDHEPGPGGTMQLTARGDRRVQFIATRVRADQLLLADVVALEAEAPTGVAGRHEHLVELLRRAYRALDPALEHDAHLNDATWVGYRLAEMLPLPPARRQFLLELTNPTLRLEALAQFIEELRAGDEMQRR